MTDIDVQPDDWRSGDPHPDTPVIDDAALKEIGEFEVEDLGGGVLVFRQAVTGDTEEVFKYIDAQSEVSHQNRWEYIVGEDGEKYGINEDGFRYRPEDIPATPVRLLHPVTKDTPDVPREFFHGMEDTIDKALLRYID